MSRLTYNNSEDSSYHLPQVDDEVDDEELQNISAE